MYNDSIIELCVSKLRNRDFTGWRMRLQVEVNAFTRGGKRVCSHLRTRLPPRACYTLHLSGTVHLYV